MAKPQVKAVEHLLGTAVPYAYAVKAGPWIFLTGHEAFDFTAGVSEAVSGPAGFPLFGRQRWRREGDFILQRMRRILEEFGSDLGHGVRLDQFYPTPAAVDPYHLARRAAFGDYIPPSTSVIMERCFGAESGISTSLIAVMPGSEYEIRKVSQGRHGIGQLRLCADHNLQRPRLRRRADGERARARIGSARPCPRPHAVGRHRDP